MSVTDLLGQAVRRTERFARYASGIATGIRHGLTGTSPKPGMDDITLQRKVESIVFRPAGAPKGSVDVNVVEGVVYLHGQVKTAAQIKALEQKVRAIPEVRGVENLLHLPNTPAPTRADAPASQRKSRRTAPKSASPRAGNRTERVSTERGKASGAPSPTELAARREGRQAAPLGGEEDRDAR